jgi:branched-chain amino acid transport system substrate-binding protein
MNTRLAQRGVAGVLVGAAVAAATGCGSDDTATSSTSTPGAATAASPAAIDWAVQYAGGKAGKAAGAPVKVGYINQQGGASGFEGATVGYTALQDFMNAHAGGVQGRPLQFVSCFVQAEEDGQKCAAQFLTQGVQLAVTGQLVVGSAAFYKTLNGRIPVINSSPGSPADLTAPNVYGTTAGALQLTAMGKLINTRIKPKSVAVIYQNDPVGSFIAQKLLKPQLVAAGIGRLKLVPFELTATTPDMVTALQAAGAATSDLVVGIVTGPPCQSFAMAYKQLALKTKVITEADCYSNDITKAIGGRWPSGWYFVGNQGYDPHIPDSASGTDTYLAAMNASARGRSWVYDVHAAYTAGPAMLAYKLLNQAGPDATAAQLTTALKAYKGPVAMNTGTFACGALKTAPNVCVPYVSFVESDGDKWLPTAHGQEAIDAGAAS